MYEIMMQDKVVGHAQIKKEGLYYKIYCACTPPNGDVHRIKVTDGANERDLGICVPEGNKFVLTTRVPMKYLEGDRLYFTLVPRSQAVISVPVADGEPFEPLDKLETARLQAVNGQMEILIEPALGQPDSDPIPEYPNISEWQ